MTIVLKLNPVVLVGIIIFIWWFLNKGHEQ